MAETKPVEKTASVEELLAKMQKTIEEQDRRITSMARREAAREKATKIGSERDENQGVAAFLDEQDRGGGAAVTNRPDRPTRGAGNDLPDAPFYRVVVPYRDPQTGKPEYTGVTLNVPFYGGKAVIPDREMAWRLKVDFGYSVEPVFETQQVVPVDLVPVGASRESPGGLGPA